MWVTKLLISPVKKRIFCPTTTKFGPKFVFLVNLGQAMKAYSVPCWWVGRWLWRAGCISQDTYLLYVLYIYMLDAISSSPRCCRTSSALSRASWRRRRKPRRWLKTTSFGKSQVYTHTQIFKSRRWWRRNKCLTNGRKRRKTNNNRIFGQHTIFVRTQVQREPERSRRGTISAGTDGQKPQHGRTGPNFFLATCSS